MARKHPPVADHSRGTALWGMNAFRSDGLTRLLDDLVDLEAQGLQTAQCDQVKAALSKIAARAAAVPDGSFWRKTILSEFEKFAEVYHEWNALEGATAVAREHRRQAMKRLRQCRNDIATRIRMNQHILYNELDLLLVEGMYTALRDLSTSLPNLFKSVSSAVTRFETRKQTA
jgi:hypothetical protein